MSGSPFNSAKFLTLNVMDAIQEKEYQDNSAKFLTLNVIGAIQEKEYQDKQGVPITWGSWNLRVKEKVDSNMMDAAIDLMFAGESPIDLRKRSSTWMNFFIQNKKKLFAWEAINSDREVEQNPVSIGGWSTGLSGKKRHFCFCMEIQNTGKTEFLKVLEENGHKIGRLGDCMFTKEIML